MKVPTEKTSDTPALSRREFKSNQPAERVLPRLAYSMQETAKLLGVNYQTVYRLNKRGLLRSSTALRTKLFPASEIQRFLDATMPSRMHGHTPVLG